MTILRKYWLKWNLRRAYAGSKTALSRMYVVKDPWGVESQGERVRFQETARLIREKLGAHFGTVLEVGCGEGAQTQYLAPLAGKIVGLDLSQKAVQRAIDRKIPNASFEVADLMNYQPPSQARFDLVTACEVIYYMQDLEQAFAKLSALGRACFVTYFSGRAERLDAFFVGKNVVSETIRSSNVEWKVVHWRQE